MGRHQHDEKNRLVGASRGDEQDLECLLWEHLDGLYAWALYRVGGDRILAEDVVQQTLLQALEQAGQYDASRGPVRSWLRGLSRNVIRRLLRTQRRTMPWSDVSGDVLAQVAGALDTAPLPDDLVMADDLRRFVGVVMANLPDRYQKVLWSKYAEGLTMEELGAGLGLSHEAAKSLLARARRAFRAEFVEMARKEQER